PLLRGVRGQTGATPLAGATSTGFADGGDVTVSGDGVAVLVLTAGPYRFGIGSACGLAADGEAAGRHAVRAARADADAEALPHAAALLLTDAMSGNQQAALTGIFRVTGVAVPVVGGAASDDRRLEGTFVFHDARVLRDAAVVVWIGSPHP